MRKTVPLVAVALASAACLTACSGVHESGGTPTPVSAPSGSVADGAGVPNNGAPKVENPLPDKVLSGSPCDSALTASQLSTYMGAGVDPAKPSEASLGATCQWGNKESGAALTVIYQTKSDQGISLSYASRKPQAKRWTELDPVQGYPAIGYATEYLDDSRPKGNCVVVVGVSDKLAYSLSLVLGDSAAASGKDACTLGRVVADSVLTNLKARA